MHLWNLVDVFLAQAAAGPHRLGLLPKVQLTSVDSVLHVADFSDPEIDSDCVVAPGYVAMPLESREGLARAQNLAVRERAG